MSKAITGAVELAGAVGMGVAAFMNPALLASPMFDKIWAGLIIGGVSMEAGAIAGALTSNRGMEITTRQPASYRQVIYGQQRVGGVFVYRSTTGSHKDQFNFVIVLAGHEVHSIQNLYLDGRQVHWQVGSAGNTTRNGVNFGGIADNGTYTGPDGLYYNFGGTGHSGLYCEARYGDQLPGDVISALTANDPNWAARGSDSPWLGGCTYVYLKLEANTTLFPSEPEIKFTVNGKNNIYDPRTGTTGFTSNWALIAADVITDPVFGLGDPSVNQAQLIAAANVCDEQMPLAAIPGTTEARYATHYHCDTSTAPGDVLATMMLGAAGRLSRIGGEWFLWPAYWQGPSFSFGEGDITSDIQWKPYRSVRDLINRVNGTYIAPSYPYNVAGNQYDKNGFYFGSLQNNFPFAFQPTNYPQYASDTLHGYASDEWLNADGGIQHPKELALITVLSVTQAQRVAKIELLRNRQQGSGTLEMSLKAFAMQPCDLMTFSSPTMGWAGKTLEVTGLSFKTDSQSGDDVPSIRCGIDVIETEASVYAWSTTEELTVYDVPAGPAQTSPTPAPPTNVTLLSGAGTAVVGVDGTITPRIEVQWDTPLDILVRQIQIQYQIVGDSVWLASTPVDVSQNLAYISGVIPRQVYNVRIRSVRANGAFSDWVEIDGYTAGTTLPVVFGISPIAPGILIAEAPASGTVDILVPPFTATVGSVSVSVLPFGDYYIHGLLENTLYYVYYVDPTFSGGSIVPIATTSISDFVGKLGYYLIDSVKTPAYISGSGNFSPSYYNDIGNSITVNPRSAFDGYTASSAVVNSRTGVTGGTAGTLGQCMYLGFPNVALSYDTTLKITATISTIDNAPCLIVASIGGVNTTLISTTTSQPQATYMVTVPRNTNLSMISLTVTANGAGGLTSSTAQPVTVSIAEIFIPYVGLNTDTGSDSNTAGLGHNLVPNGDFALGNIDGWTTSGASYGSGGLLLEAGAGSYSASFPVIPGEKYKLSVTAKLNGAGAQGEILQINYSDTNAANITTGSLENFPDTLTGTFATYSHDWVCPAGMFYASVGLIESAAAELLYVNVSAQQYVTASWGSSNGSDTIARDTVYVNGVPSTSISPIAGLMPLETGADKTKNHVLTTSIREPLEDPGGGYVLLRYGTLSLPSASSCAYTVADYSVIVNDPSDVFNLYAVIQCSGTAGSSGYPQALGYVDCPVVVGTSPYYGGTPPSTSTYQTFGFGAGTGNCTFAGTVTGLSIGSHTLSVIFMNYTSYDGTSTGNAYLYYVSSYLVQVSS